MCELVCERSENASEASENGAHGRFWNMRTRDPPQI